MTTTRRLAIAAAAAAALITTLLSGCTPAVRDESRPAATARPSAAADDFRCPGSDQIGALAGVPFTAERREGTACRYRTGTAEPTTVTIEHGVGGRAPGVLTLDTARAALRKQGTRTTAASDLAPGAFTTGSAASCSAWVYADDGEVTRVAAIRGGDVTTSACTLARSAAVVLDPADHAARPIVSLLASDGTLTTAAARTRWTTHLGRELGAEVERVPSAGAGYTGSTRTGFGAAAQHVDPESAAVVLLSTPVRDTDRLALLRAATAAYSTAAATAPRARIVVVGPVAGPGTTQADLARLRADLRTAATVAGALYVDPAPASAGLAASQAPGALDLAADRLERLLEAEWTSPRRISAD